MTGGTCNSPRCHGTMADRCGHDPACMRLTIIDRYILREILLTCGAVLAVLLLILLTNTLIYMLGQVVDGRIAGDSVLPLFLANVSHVVVMLVPPGLYLGVLLTFGRLHADSEMSALQACGYGPARLYRPVVIAAVVVAAFAAFLSLQVAPWAQRADHDIRARLAERSELTGIAAGQFTPAAGGSIVLFAERRADDGTLEGVFVEAEAGRTGEPVIVRAAEAVERRDDETGWRYVEFRDGARYEGVPGSASFTVVEFDRHGLRLPQPERQQGRPDREALSIAELRSAGGPKDIAEIQWRLSVPVGCLTLALAALPLARTTPRKGRYSRIAIALLLYMLYANFMVVAREAVADGLVPGAIGMWWAHAVVLLLIAALVVHHNGWRWSLEALGLRRAQT